jgi:translation initiation factor 6
VTKLVSYRRNPNIGVIGRANDQLALLPAECPRSFEKLVSEVLEVEVVKTNICGTSLLGTMIAMNNNGIIVPTHAYSEEVEKMQRDDVNVGVIKDRYTALGNLVLLNDKGAVAAEGFSKRSIKQMEDVLGCEVVRGTIAGFRIVGSAGIATNKGALVHPLASDEELKWLEEILKVNVDVGTVNRGAGFVRTGIIVNSRDVLIGDQTTGPEITRIEDSLGLL